MAEKIAILGGGCGAMAAAFWITSRPNWQHHFDVTVYQMGWRLGGKGASGRGTAERIEEHGLHLWGGFYQNAFHLMRRCYGELGLDWSQAFSRIDNFCATELHKSKWIPWSVQMPRLPGLPGDVDPGTNEPYGAPTAAQIAQRALEWLYDQIDSLPVDPGLVLGKHSLLGAIEGLGLAIAARFLGIPAILLTDPLQWAWKVTYELGAFFTALGAGGSKLRRLGIMSDIAMACITGMLRDRVLELGFDQIERWELKSWLSDNGAAQSSIDSPMVMGGYDYVFGYAQGDIRRPSLSAAVALRGFGRLLLGYRGSFFWALQGGMGDVIFEPLYGVLRQRGVRFEFFHRVDHLEPSADGKRVAAIHVHRQVKLAGANYDPFITTAAGARAWPSQPNFDQIVDGQQLQQQWDKANLELPWSTWPVAEKRVLRDGHEFDRVVLGIPLGALQTVCKPLAQINGDWDKMLKHLETVPTLSCQLWTQRTTAQLGWTPSSDPVVTNYEQRFNTLADMSHLVPFENTGKLGAQGIVYLCGPLAADAIPAGTTQAAADRQIAADARQWVSSCMRVVIPGYTDQALVTFAGGGAGAFERQYFRANFAPSERYVLSLPGTASARLAAGDGKFANLLLAGDWTANGLNAGCVEAAVISGAQAARALWGDPRPVPGSVDT